MNATTIDDDGKILIPEKLRKQLNLLPGKKIELSIQHNTIVIRKVIDASEYEQIADQLSTALKETNSRLEFEKLF